MTERGRLVSLGIGVFRYLVLPALGLLAACLLTRWLSRRSWGGWRLARVCPRSCLAGYFVLGTVVFGGLVTARYLTWHSFVHDLGSYDQKIWLISVQSDPWSMLRQTWLGGTKGSPCGVERYWGVCHFQPLQLIPALIYKIWSSPLLLLWIQVLAVMSGMIPLFLLARRCMGSSESGVAMCLLYLLFPAVQYNALLDFRPDFVAIPLLLWAFHLADRGRCVSALAAAAGMSLMKETLFLTFAGFGLYVWLKHGRRTLGLGAFALGLVAFYVIAFRLLSGVASSEAEFFISRFFMGNPLETILRRDKLIYLAALFGPLAGLPLLSPLALLPAAPMLAISLLSSLVTHASIDSQYTASAVGPLLVALMEALPRLEAHLGSRAQPIPVLAGLIVLSAFVAFAVGPTPLSMNFWSRSWGGHWHYTQYLPDRQTFLNRAESLIPTDPEVTVVTQNDVNSARLAHRHAYYALPNELAGADYVFLDTRRIPFVYWSPDPHEYHRILAGLRRDPAFDLVFDQEGVLVFRRSGARRSPSAISPPGQAGSFGHVCPERRA